MKVRWFVIEPVPEGTPKELLDAAVKAAFAGFGADHHMIDTTRNSAMHETHTLDVICLLKGDASLILEGTETRIKPGQVVIQRATNHALGRPWRSRRCSSPYLSTGRSRF